MTYSIPENNLDRLVAEIARLTRKAAKLGAPAITLTVGESSLVPFERVDALGERETYYVRQFSVTLEGTTPKFAGWTLAGVISALPLEDGSVEGIAHAVPGETLPRELAGRFGECDHCRQSRARNDVFAVRHETGAYQVVGSTCLGDFLGGVDPHALASACEDLVRAGQLCAGAEDEDFYGLGGGESRQPEIGRVLALAASVIRHDGFVSKARAREACNVVSTADQVGAIFSSRRDDALRAKYRPTEADYAVAEAAREWAREQYGSDSDYLHNLGLVARSVSVERRTLGLACAMVSSYQRQVAEASALANGAGGQHIGQPGERLTMTLTFESSRQSASEWGLTTICTYRTPGGDVVIWYASGSPDAALMGADSFPATFTVKRHGEYKGVRQTVVTRVTVAKPAKVKRTTRAIALAA